MIIQNKLAIPTVLFILLLLAAGYWGGLAWQKYQVSEAQKKMHAQIAAIRTYEEAYALRHGHYLLVPDSCSNDGQEHWQKLGKPKPDVKVGCFRVEANLDGSTAGTTSPTMKIVAVHQEHGLIGIETNEDKQPTWSSLHAQ